MKKRTKSRQTTDMELSVLLKCHQEFNKLNDWQLKRVVLYLLRRHGLCISHNENGIFVNLK